MPQFKEGDRVRIVTRPVTEEDRKSNSYFEHMAGLTGTVQNLYGSDGVAVKIDTSGVTKISQDVHKESTRRMREKFVSSVSDEQRKQLTPEELSFEAHYMLLVKTGDLEKV